MNRRLLVYMAYGSIMFALLWGAGIVLAILVIRNTRTIPADADNKTKRDLRGARLLARGGFVLNSLVIAAVVWSVISNFF